MVAKDDETKMIIYAYPGLAADQDMLISALLVRNRAYLSAVAHKLGRQYMFSTSFR
jgi:hypothetical protein